MLFQQYFLGCLAHASYLIGDEKVGEAAVIDPQRDVQQYLDDARRAGLRIKYVVLTHFHADFVAGHLELRDRVGARIALGARAKAAYDFAPLAEGSELQLGEVRLRALETPGHTPEGITLLVFDGARDREHPWAALTGDTLFIGDVGRPDLMASAGASADDLATQLYDSIHQKLLMLPDDTLVYPAHGAGSMCGKALSQERVSTIGEQRRSNYALREMPRDEFIKLVTADQPEPPAYFAFDAQKNREELPTLEASLQRALRPLSLDELLAEKGSGAQILDARDPGDFEAAHLAGAINVGLQGKFATYAGTVLDKERPIALVADPGREQEAALRLGRIGFDRVIGFLDGGMAALAARPELVRQIARVTADELRQKMQAPDAPLVLDVRGPAERAGASIAPSVHIPLGQLERRLDELPHDRPLVVHCASGYRSAIACSLLAAHGLAPSDLLGGIAAWQR
jgi:glyoxylase-like metal-dependent hydrolase (beta-lactamase superfamily II)/rhodanese-related sulfurtransferase